MSGNGQNEQEGGKEDGGEAGRDMYRPKSVSTVVRVLTVFAYLFSVSFAAILLSVYYVCVWKSPELPPLQNARIGLDARRGEPHEYHQNLTEDSTPFDYPGTLSNRNPCRFQHAPRLLTFAKVSNSPEPREIHHHTTIGNGIMNERT